LAPDGSLELAGRDLLVDERGEFQGELPAPPEGGDVVAVRIPGPGGAGVGESGGRELRRLPEGWEILDRKAAP
jgi:hypothetical protein